MARSAQDSPARMRGVAVTGPRDAAVCTPPKNQITEKAFLPLPPAAASFAPPLEPWVQQRTVRHVWAPGWRATCGRASCRCS